jgi:cobalt-zinc-cadmium efflux system protein
MAQHAHSHTHDHGHDHAHGHTHAPASFGRAFAVGIILNALYVGLEATYGLLTGSLALLADAGHNASDVLSLIVAWTAARLALRPPSGRYTYGLRRSPILASLFNALLLLVAIGAIIIEAVQRFGQPTDLAGGTVFWVAAVGLVINTGTALMFASGKDDLNVRGAYLHLLADAGVTLGVMVAGVLIALTGANWLDPVISLAIAGVVLWSTWGLLRGALEYSLDAAPRRIDLEGVRLYLGSLPGVTDVHDLHVWPLSTTQTALTAHLVIPQDLAEPDRLLHETCHELHARFSIEHATLQLEKGDLAHPCHLTGHGAV